MIRLLAGPPRWDGDTATVGLFPVQIHVWPADTEEDPGKWWASLELPGGSWIPVARGAGMDEPFPSRDQARDAAEGELARRLALLHQALQGLTTP